MATAPLCWVPGDSGARQEPKNGAVEMGTEVAVLSPWGQIPLKGLWQTQRFLQRLW